MEIVSEYDKLCQKVWVLQNDFYKKYNIKPNTVNVGHDEFYTLKSGNRFLMENGTKIKDEEFTLFGMKLKHVNEDNYVGYTTFSVVNK